VGVHIEYVVGEVKQLEVVSLVQQVNKGGAWILRGREGKDRKGRTGREGQEGKERYK